MCLLVSILSIVCSTNEIGSVSAFRLQQITFVSADSQTNINEAESVNSKTWVFTSFNLDFGEKVGDRHAAGSLIYWSLIKFFWKILVTPTLRCFTSIYVLNSGEGR